jgi:phytoene dehydrogenase-like protein
MPAALEKTYDGIIIGAGHHGLVLGSYLAKCGLDILLVDRRLQYGGGLSTEEVTAPGFCHNLHSINHRDALVQGPEPVRACHLHHAALRARPAASRRLGAGVRPRP